MKLNRQDRLMQENPKESDWKALRKIVPDLRERYLQARIEEFTSVLNDGGLNSTEKFWEIDERTRDIAKTLQACLDGHSRSKMELFIGMMLRNEMMSEEDLSIFSPKLQERMKQRLSLQ